MEEVRIATIEAKLGYDRVVRVIPNMSANKGKGLSVWYTKSNIANDDVEILLKPLGDVVKANDENELKILAANEWIAPSQRISIEDLCPEDHCSGELVYKEGRAKCHSCGYSRC